MRDNGIREAQDRDGLDWFQGLAQEALGRLVSVRDLDGADVRQDHLDHFMQALAAGLGADADTLLDGMVARKVDAVTVACRYVPEAARILGDQWLADQISFVQVTLGTERLQGVVRLVDTMLSETFCAAATPSALVLVPEAEQHTLGAHVLALRLRLQGFRAAVRVAPTAGDLTQLVAANRFDLALVSIGCTAALDSGVGLVRTLKLLSRGEMWVFAGGSIPVDDATLLDRTGADRVLRDIFALKSEYEACKSGRGIDRDGRRNQGSATRSLLKGDGGDQ
jgi:methylmalonyl-CoA mutase cobalamin-binding subunit